MEALPQLFDHVLEWSMKTCGLYIDVVAQTASLMQQVTLIKTHGRQAIGNLSKLIVDTSWMEGVYNSESQFRFQPTYDANHIITHTPLSKDYIVPIEAFKQELARHKVVGEGI